METFTFKENVFQLAMYAGVFGLGAAITAVALAIKAGENPLWLLGAGLAALVAAFLISVVVKAYRARQTITVSPQGVKAVSGRGKVTEIAWHDMARVRDYQNLVDEIREKVPGIEFFAGQYLMIPQGTGQRRGVFLLEANDGRVIAVRQHMIYEHRLMQFVDALEMYGPSEQETPSEEILKSNKNN